MSYFTKEIELPKIISWCIFNHTLRCCCSYSEWLNNQHRDTYASFVGHHDLLSYFALVDNESRERLRFVMLQVNRSLIVYFRY